MQDNKNRRDFSPNGCNRRWPVAAVNEHGSRLRRERTLNIGAIGTGGVAAS